MSEHLPRPTEKKEHAPSPESARQEKERLEHLKHQAEKAERQHRNIEQLKERAESIAKSRKEVTAAEKGEKKHEPVIGMQRELKSQAYKETMRKVRRHLSPANRSFSKFIHQPAVDAVSEFSAKTVARPSAILGGGIVALLGSGFILFMAKYYGFRYNFFVYIGLLAVGFVAGVLIELLVRAVHRSKN